MRINPAFSKGQEAATQVINGILKGQSPSDALHDALFDFLDGMTMADVDSMDSNHFVRGYFQTIQKVLEGRS